MWGRGKLSQGSRCPEASAESAAGHFWRFRSAVQWGIPLCRLSGLRRLIHSGHIPAAGPQLRSSGLVVQNGPRSACRRLTSARIDWMAVFAIPGRVSAPHHTQLSPPIRLTALCTAALDSLAAFQAVAAAGRRLEHGNPFPILPLRGGSCAPLPPPTATADRQGRKEKKKGAGIARGSPALPARGCPWKQPRQSRKRPPAGGVR